MKYRVGDLVEVFYSKCLIMEIVILAGPDNGLFPMFPIGVSALDIHFSPSYIEIKEDEVIDFVLVEKI